MCLMNEILNFHEKSSTILTPYKWKFDIMDLILEPKEISQNGLQFRIAIKTL